MIVTLTYGATTITLPPDTYWSDEHTWFPVEQAVNTSITGATIMDVSVRQAQRPITLVSDERHAWLPFATLQTLKAWAELPGVQMTLNIRGFSRTVVFRHHEKPALDVVAVVDYSTPEPTDWFYGQLKFMEV